MKKTNCGRRGFTLVEITVVLALVGILTTVAVMIVAMVSKSVIFATAEDDRITISRNVQMAVERMISQYDKADCDFEVYEDVDGVSHLKASDGAGTLCDIYHRDGKVIVTDGEGNEFASSYIGRIATVTFETYRGTGGALIRCTVTTKHSEPYTYTFVTGLRCASVTE